MAKNLLLSLIIGIVLGIIGMHSSTALADEPVKVTSNGNCAELKLTQIPVADFLGDMVLPLVGETKGWRRTQRYNTKLSDPDCYKPGHNGTDVGGEYGGAVIGEEEIRNVLNGITLISRWLKGWGESTTVVSRVNEFSEELITTSFHHLDVRYVAHCRIVQPNQLIGMEGKSGDKDWLAHLHFTVRRWANIDHLLNWLDRKNGSYYVFGERAYFGHDGIKFKGSYEPGASNITPTSPYYNYGHLDPEKLLFNTYTDYQLDPGQPQPPYFWSLSYALKMRRYGIEFGLWDGRFGAQEPAKRREVARWLKITAQRQSANPSTSTFDDVPTDDPDFPYIEAMARYPQEVPTVNPNHTCHSGTRDFCPDENINRAEALKMVILAFYSNLYLKAYNDDVWNIAPNLALQNLMLFQDVSPYDWYASYVYFGTIIGLVENQTHFNPDQPVMREEMAKWVITAYELLHGSTNDLCSYTVCQQGQFCDPSTGWCQNTAECIPSETQQCEVGGGYVAPDPCATNPACAPGQTKTQSCGNGGTQTSICTSECQWGAWGVCTGSGVCQSGQTASCGNCGTMTCLNNQWGTCQNEGICAPGQTDQQVCNVTGSQSRTCGSNCQWGSWTACSVQQVCTSGQTQQQNCTIGGQPGTQTRTCDSSGQWGSWSTCATTWVCTPGQTQEQNCTTGGNPGTQTRTCDSSGQWGSWGTCIPTCACSSGLCCDGCNYKSASAICNSWTEYRCQGTSPGQDAQYMDVEQHCTGYSTSCTGQYTDTGWLTYDNCSSSEKCVMSGTMPQCVSSCTDTYVASATESCYSGNPSSTEICLNLQQVSGSTWKYRICKGSGTFQNNVDFEIIDLKHSSQYLSSGTGGQGSSCTPWKNISMSYITGYGSTNGASLRGQLYSPSGCTQATCFFRSSLITLNLECQ